MNYLNELIAILNDMSPYLILGFLISGLLHVYVPKSLYARFLQRKGIRSVFGAAILGIPLPLCSCGVIPTAMSLKKEGASDGATVSFLVSTPQTGIDSILATYSLLGFPFAIIRPIAAFFVAIFGGVAIDKFGNQKKKKPSTPQFSYVHTETKCSCGCSDKHDHVQPKKSIRAALRYGFVDMMHDFGKWLTIGLLVAAAITAFVPDSVFTTFKHHYMLNILIILIISTPMYICATGSIPIALSLIMKGASAGAAFVLLIAGPATNIASLIILRKKIGLRKTIIYLISIIIGSIACAFIIDFILPAEWFSAISPMGAESQHCAHEDCRHFPVWIQTASSLLFVALFINSIIRRKLGKDKGCCSHS